MKFPGILGSNYFQQYHPRLSCTLSHPQSAALRIVFKSGLMAIEMKPSEPFHLAKSFRNRQIVENFPANNQKALECDLCISTDYDVWCPLPAPQTCNASLPSL